MYEKIFWLPNWASPIRQKEEFFKLDITVCISKLDSFYSSRIQYVYYIVHYKEEDYFLLHDYIL